MAARGQPTATVHRIGFLGSTSPKSHGAFVDTFRDGLRERGYVEGKNVTIEYRWADGDYSRLAPLAAEAATTSIPIVVTVVGDAVATGLVQSFARPGLNVTGSSFSFPELNAKRIEMLKEALPGLKRAAVLMNATNVGNVVTFEAMARTARSVQVDVVQVFASRPEDFEAAFDQMTNARAEAVAVYEDALFISQA